MLGAQSKIWRTNSLIIKLCICVIMYQLNFIKWASDLTTRVGNVHQLLVLFFLYWGLLGFLGTNNPMHWWVAPWVSTRTSSAVPIKRLDYFTQRMSKWQYGLASVGFITATGWAGPNQNLWNGWSWGQTLACFSNWWQGIKLPRKVPGIVVWLYEIYKKI